MLAPRILPPAFLEWNRKWHAPNGRVSGPPWPLRFLRRDLHYRGPFAWQSNNDTRVFEYPWVYHEIQRLGSPLTILELGGGLSGLQFVLSQEGHVVTNIDPGLVASGVGFALDPGWHSRMCHAFRAPVRLISATIRSAGIADHSVDVIVSVSALEHFSDADLADLAEHIPRVLKPQGRLISTVDLFLDLQPFCCRETNRFGKNIDIRRFLDESSLTLEVGAPAELLGFGEFASEAILCNLEAYLLGRGYPALVQCFVARRANQSGA